jgi:hypothetical protein
MEEIPQLREAVERVEDSDEALREWLRDRPEAEMLTGVTKPRSYGGAGVGNITVKVAKPGRPCYYTVRRSGTLFVSKTHPNSRGNGVPAPEANDDLLRRAVEYYPRFVVRLIDEVNAAATEFEAALPDEAVPEMMLTE